MNRYDVIVIGAGPVGSYTALHLAQRGVRVQLLEEHAVIGEPRHCTGVLSREAFDQFPDLPREPIQSDLHAAWIVPPNGRGVRTQWFEQKAFVIQRALFDRMLAEKALKAGAEVRTGTRVETLERTKDCVTVQTESTSGGKDTWQASYVVIASGISYKLHEQLGIQPPTQHLYCAQIEVASDHIQEVEVYIGHMVAPGSFAWAVPLGNGRVRVGVTAHRMAAQSLETLLQNGSASGRTERRGELIRKRPIPIAPIACSAYDRVLIAGDAAGQVKPTTGGGIYYGLIGAAAAVQTLDEAMLAGRWDASFLMRYDRRWKRRLRSEMWMERFSRKIFEHMSDEQLDRLVDACRHEKISKLIQSMALFDWHGKALLSFLSSPRVLTQLF